MSLNPSTVATQSTSGWLSWWSCLVLSETGMKRELEVYVDRNTNNSSFSYYFLSKLLHFYLARFLPFVLRKFIYKS